MENFYMFREVYTWKNPNGDEKLKATEIFLQGKIAMRVIYLHMLKIELI